MSFEVTIDMDGMVHETERAAFERAVLAAPDDDAPRLVFADWLEERGDEEYAANMRHVAVRYWLRQYPKTPRTVPLREYLSIRVNAWFEYKTLPLPLTRSDFFTTRHTRTGT